MQIAAETLQLNRPSTRWIELLLTVRNCELYDLHKTVTDMKQAFRTMIKLPGWPGLGAARGLEVKRAENCLAHPHYHGVVAVNASHFSGQRYLSKEDWANMWKEALGLVDEVYVGTRNLQGGEKAAGEAAEIMGYSQEDPPEDDDDILWRMRAWKEIQGINRVQYYGLVKALMPLGKVKADPHVEEWIKSKNRMARRIKFRWVNGAFEPGSW